MRRIRLLSAAAVLAVTTLLAGASPPAAFAVAGGSDVPDGVYPYSVRHND